MDSLTAERLEGLKFAKNAGFTDSEYEEALKMVDLPSDKNKLLLSLIKVRETIDKSSTATATTTSSSCYSSIASFPSSSNQSLENFQQQQSSKQIPKKTIYIDGANVARSHGKNGTFSWPGIKICVDWFLARQHPVKVFVPVERCQQCPEPEILDSFEKSNILVEIPIGYNDDLCVIEAARQKKAVIVSNDQFREERRLNAIQRLDRLSFVFVDDLFLPADPQGRPGLPIEEFLSEPPGRYLQNSFPTRIKSHQKYQRYGSLKNHSSMYLPNSHHRLGLLTTSSLPVETASKTVSNDLAYPSTGANVQHYSYQLGNHRQDNSHTRKLEKSVSEFYSGASSINNTTKERDIQNIHRPKKQNLSGTKSHNI